jgi:SAM-dependent methyltransferase
LIGRFLHRLVAVVEDLAPDRLLDAGCGEGFVARALGEAMPSLSIVGADIDADALGLAADIAPQVARVRADVCRLPWPDDSFPLVIATEVLEHVPDGDRALAEFVRVSGAHLILSVPHEPWFAWGNLARLKNVRRGGRDPDHVRFWTRGGFVDFVSQRAQIVACWKPFPWTLVLARV